MFSEEEIEYIKEANKRIKEIRKKFNEDSWALKKLSSKLSLLDKVLTPKAKLISRSKNIDEINKQALLKAVNNFLNSKTSTLEGIQDVEDRIKSEIKDYTSTIDKKGNIVELNDSDIESLYTLFEDKDFIDLSKYIPPSDIHILITETKKFAGNKNEKKEFFIKQIKTYAEFGNDFDINKTINKLFNKIIK